MTDMHFKRKDRQTRSRRTAGQSETRTDCQPASQTDKCKERWMTNRWTVRLTQCYKRNSNVGQIDVQIDQHGWIVRQTAGQTRLNILKFIFLK
jgi:hypothetical protein